MGTPTTNPFDVARAEAMIRGYDARWSAEQYEVLAVEVEFRAPLVNPETGAPSRTWQRGGKLDAIVRELTGHRRIGIVEHKTSSDDITPGSSYWKQLRMDGQVSGYFVGADALGFPAEFCLYDVLGKPTLRPYKVGLKRKVDETPDEFRLRCMTAIAEAPDCYYRRGEVVRLEAEAAEALFDDWQTAVQMREAQRLGRFPRPGDAALAEARPEARGTGERHLVLGVGQHPQVRQHVLDVPLLEEAQAGAHLVGDVAAGQLDLELEGVAVIAVQRGDLGERRVLVDELEDALGDERRLLEPLKRRVLVKVLELLFKLFGNVCQLFERFGSGGRILRQLVADGSHRLHGFLHLKGRLAFLEAVPGQFGKLTANLLDVLLVGPSGQSVLLMSDVGQGNSLNHATLSFSDAAPNSLSESAPLATGVYRPTDYSPDDNFPVPAPLGPYANSLAAFNGTGPLPPNTGAGVKASPSALRKSTVPLAMPA